MRLRSFVFPICAIALSLVGCGQPTAGGSSSTGNALTARVFSPDGRPVSGDTVHLRIDVSDSVTQAFGVRRTDSLGYVRFDDVPSGAWTLEARGANNGRFVRLRLSRDSSGLELRTGAYATIAGSMRLPDSSGSASAFLAGSFQTTGLDQDGRFRFERVSPGIHHVVAMPRKDGALGRSTWTNLDIQPASGDTLAKSIPAMPRAASWRLNWTDDFQALNTTRWNLDTGDGCPDLCGWGKNALQSFKTENTFLRDGALVLRAEKTPDGWTSGQVQTRGDFQFRYGRLEVDAILPGARGAWSLISLQGDSIGRVWPRSGAIDIAGLWGYRPDTLMGIAHRADDLGNAFHPGSDFASSGNWSGRKVTYAVEWTPTEIVWFADDRVFFRIDGGTPFDHSFYLSIGLTVGGDGNVAPDTDTAFELVVEQVRFYQRTP